MVFGGVNADCANALAVPIAGSASKTNISRPQSGARTVMGEVLPGIAAISSRSLDQLKLCHRRRRASGNPMPEAIDLLTSRRSVKPIELSGPGPTAADLSKLLTVASRVPDHGKLTPWRFIVFEGDARLKAGDVIEAAFRQKYPDSPPEQIEYERKRLARAPLVIAVVSRAGAHVKIPEWDQVLSAGASAMSLVLGAHALGYA